MIKQFSARTLGSAVLVRIALATACFAPLAQADWKGWNVHPAGYPVTVAMESFIKHVKKATDGRVSGRIYNGAILGNQEDAIQMMQVGGIDFAEFNLGPIGLSVPEVNVVSLPFIFRSVHQMRHVMYGPVGDKLSKAMAKQGIISLAWYESGSRSFYNTSHPINKPTDMTGMKIRVMKNALYVGMVEALGGNATPMDYSEVYQSLKTGVIDGAENNWPSYDSSNHFEVAKYYSLTQHLIMPETLSISSKAWAQLSPKDQKVVRKAAQDSAMLERKLWAEKVKDSRKKLIADGVIVNEIKDKAAFQDAMQPVYVQAAKDTPSLKPLIEQIRNTK